MAKRPVRKKPPGRGEAPAAQPPGHMPAQKKLPDGTSLFPAAQIPQKDMSIIPTVLTADVLALKSLATGTANSDQQIRALKMIVETFADYGGVCVNPQEALAHAGRRFVGVCIVQTLARD